MAKKLGMTLGVALLGLLPAATASADNVTFAVIGPHEYELPVNFKDFDAFVQYGFANASNQYYTLNGNLSRQMTSATTGKLAPVPNQDFNVGLTKVVRFISFDSLPNVGFAPEAIIPEVNLNSGFGANQYGIADPVFGGAMWIKPNKDSTFGFQTFITAPIGTSNFTSRYYSNISTILFDYQFKHWDFDGDAGATFRSTFHPNAVGSAPLDEGTSFFTNLRFGWKLNQPSIPVEPFFALDYEYDTASKNAVTQQSVPMSRMEELALGAGGVITISDKYSLTLRYSRGVYGLNEYPTNAAYVKFVSILP